jgi:hypothetical protein
MRCARPALNVHEQKYQFLHVLGQPPARLTADQVAWVLNCQPHDIPVLVAARLLRPLGQPQPNSVKYFAKATNAVSAHWRDRNRRRLGGDFPAPPAPERIGLS